MNTKTRFQQYIELEEMVAAKVLELAEFGGIISRITPAQDRALYDRVVILKSGTHIKLEIQITEPKAWEKYHDVRLDLISAFQHQTNSPFSGHSKVWPEEVSVFFRNIDVSRLGKLYMTEATTLAFYVLAPVNLLWIFNMGKLQENREAFVKKYGIMINHKSSNEQWESCFVPVSESDELLDSCGIRYEGSLK